VTTFAPLWSATGEAVQLVIPLAVPELPRSVAQVTAVTPTLSDTVPEIDSVEEDVAKVPEVVGAVIVTVGAVVSGAVYVTVRTSVPTFPAASRAVTVITLFPTCRPTTGTFQFVVPVAVPLPPRSVTQLTELTPTLSEAVPPSGMLVVVVVSEAAEVGVAIDTTGGVVSAVGAAATLHVKFCAGEFRTPSLTEAVTVYVPAVEGVPEMNPVAVPMNSPGGSPDAVYVIGFPSGSLPCNWSEVA